MPLPLVMWIWWHAVLSGAFGMPGTRPPRVPRKQGDRRA